MTPGERWSHHAANVLVGGTGVVYGVMRYFVEPDDPFSVVNHPWQPHFQHLHVLLAPLLVFIVGYSWRRHIGPRLTRSDMPRYMTGISLAVSLVPMIVSGYLIQTTVEADWRKIWVVVHVVSSLLWLLGYGSHQLQRKGRRSRGRAVEEPSPGWAAVDPLASGTSEAGPASWETDPPDPRGGSATGGATAESSPIPRPLAASPRPGAVSREDVVAAAVKEGS